MSNKHAFDLYSIDPGAHKEIVTGIWEDSTTDSMAGQLFGAGVEVNQLEGSISYMPSKSTMLRESEESSSRVALGALPNQVRGALKSKSYKLKEKYSMEGSVLKAQVFNLAQIESASDLLDYILRMTIAQISFDMDVDLKALLNSTSDNIVTVAQGAWSDNALARPMSDIEALLDNGAGEYNTVVLGQDKVRELAKLDTFRTFVQNYTGTGSIEDARAPQKAVVNYLFSEHANVEKVVIGNTWYDTNGETQVVGTGRLFDGTVWAGASEHLMMLRMSALDESGQDYDPKRGVYSAFQNVHGLFLRLEDQMGAVLTGS